MRLDILAQLLEDTGLGVQGQSIFIHRMDAECTKGILLRLPIAGVETDFNLPDYYRAEFQAIVRAQIQAEGDVLAKSVTAALTFYNRDFFDTNGVFQLQVKQMYPAKLPIVYPRSDGHGIEWSLNFCAAYVQPL